ncbi:Uncharacterised protein [Staphylococcus delphini]|nr:Uncharacterised protein [Staphylococcus delphini]
MSLVKLVMIIFIFLIPQIIKLARILHMRKLGYRYEGENIVRIQKDD